MNLWWRTDTFAKPDLSLCKWVKNTAVLINSTGSFLGEYGWIYQITEQIVASIDHIGLHISAIRRLKVTCPFTSGAFDNIAIGMEFFTNAVKVSQ